MMRNDFRLIILYPSCIASDMSSHHLDDFSRFDLCSFPNVFCCIYLYSSLPLVFEQPIQNLIYVDVSGDTLRSRGHNLQCTSFLFYK